jgi:hypothetical protein
VQRISVVDQGGDALGWVAACDVGAKWDRAAHSDAASGEKLSLVEEFVHGGLRIDELTLALYKGLWHALEPARGYMSSDVRDW